MQSDVANSLVDMDAEYGRQKLGEICYKYIINM